ncbi:PQQ-dependent sugar dehydrogenase [Bacillus daqingensis]|uniref:PQQ-dependent sugar dehydrogenase n=1 Tax=Bacillus daqingensis TaxID=872396 RepID=A0ABV9NZF4_9BACI
MRKAWVMSAVVLLAACQGGEENDVTINDDTEIENENGNAAENTEPENSEIENDENNENEANEDNEADEEAETAGDGADQISLLGTGTEDWNVEIVADNLDSPWSIAVYDEENFMLTSREGALLDISDGSVTEVELDTSDAIVQEGEGGLLGFVPSESDDDSAFIYYTYESGGELLNKIAQIERTGDNWEETEVLLDEIEGARTHNGGRLAIGPDDMLYATTGDAEVTEWSQDPDVLAGSILRMTLEGEVPEDNPMDDSYVYSYGHRNPQGLAWAADDTMYSSEHGAQALDEINIIEAGNNYGWPVIEGDETEEGMEEPLLHSGDDTWAPSGTAMWQEEELVMTGLRGQSLYVLNEESEEVEVVFDGEGRLRDVLYHDGALYVLTNNTDGRGDPAEDDDRLLRLTPGQ